MPDPKSDWVSRMFDILGENPELLVKKVDTRLPRRDFEETIRAYLDERSFRHELSRQLLDHMFEKACQFRSRVLAFPQMQKLVSSDDWRLRAIFLRKLHGALSALTKEAEGKLNGPPTQIRGQLSARARQRFLHQLGLLHEDFRSAYSVQRLWTERVREYDNPSLDSRFLYELKVLLQEELQRMKEAEILHIVAACAIAAGAVPPAKDVTQVVAAKISQAESAITKYWGKDSATRQPRKRK